MKASIRALCCAAAFAVPHAGEAAAPLETDTMVGLMVKANPKLLERKAVESFAKFVWCHEYGAVRNEFNSFAVNSRDREIEAYPKCLYQPSDYTIACPVGGNLYLLTWASAALMLLGLVLRSSVKND